MRLLYIGLVFVFILTVYLLYKKTYKYYKSKNNNKLWKLWGLQTSYWEGIIIVSSLITAAIGVLFKIFIK